MVYQCFDHMTGCFHGNQVLTVIVISHPFLSHFCHPPGSRTNKSPGRIGLNPFQNVAVVDINLSEWSMFLVNIFGVLFWSNFSILFTFCSSQQAGFRHVHRTSMAVRPHCVFDVVVPFLNASQQARIPGEFCIPEHVTGGAAVGDYDGDGMEDIYFTVFHGRSVLYRNNGGCRN